MAGWESQFKGSAVDAALDRIMDDGYVHYRGRAVATGRWRMNGSGDALIPERYDGADWKAQGTLLSVRQRTLYVGKQGDDLNTGTNPDAPLLTFAAAMTRAASLTPTQAAPVLIACEDAGVYTEDLTGVAWVRIHAPGATLIPATNAGHDIKDGCHWCFFRATRIHTGFKMISGGTACVQLAECGTETGAVNGQWMFLVDGRAALLGGTLDVRVGAYRGEACICGCYGDSDEGYINFDAKSVEVVGGGTSTWWDFFAEQSVVGKHCDINVNIEKYVRLASGAGCFRPFAANPGVHTTINAVVKKLKCLSGTVCEAAKSGAGTGAYCSLIADEAEGQTIANAVTAGNTVRIIVARKPNPLVLAGVTSEIAILDPSGVTADVFTSTGRLDVTDTTPSTSPLNGSGHFGGGVGIEGDARIGGDLFVGSDNILDGRSIHVANGTADTNPGVHIHDSNFGGAGTVGGLVLSQGSITDRRLYLTGNDGGFYFRIGGYSTSYGELQFSNNQVGVAGQFRLAPVDTRAVRSNNDGCGLIMAVAAPGAFTADPDLDGYDVYFRGQSGGAHTAADPRGGDMHFIPGVAGAGGAGRQGRMILDGPFVMGSGDWHYFGDPDTDGSWRFGRSGNDWVFQRRESSAWVTKSTIVA